MKDQPPSLTDTNIHSDTQAEPLKLSSLSYISTRGRRGNQLLGKTGQTPLTLGLSHLFIRLPKGAHV
jgi:hypothetical protein